MVAPCLIQKSICLGIPGHPPIAVFPRSSNGSTLLNPEAPLHVDSHAPLTSTMIFTAGSLTQIPTKKKISMPNLVLKSLPVLHPFLFFHKGRINPVRRTKSFLTPSGKSTRNQIKWIVSLSPCRLTSRTAGLESRLGVTSCEAGIAETGSPACRCKQS